MKKTYPQIAQIHADFYLRISAAAKARRMDEHAEITIIQREADLSMASCGYPYYIGGTFDDRNLLVCTPAGVVRDPTFFKYAQQSRQRHHRQRRGRVLGRKW